MGRFEEIEERIEGFIAGSKYPEDPKHSKDVLEWVLKLKPGADESLKIAALGHDAERATRPTAQSKELELHAKKGAEIICKIMEECGYDEKTVQRVKYLIELHDKVSGGDDDVQVLRDADVLGFFNRNIYYYCECHTKEELREKIKFMFSKLSEKGKNLVKEIELKDTELNKMFKELI